MRWPRPRNSAPRSEDRWLTTSQAALPGATVNVLRTRTNEVATATTNNEGSYTIPSSAPASTPLTVEMSGFQKNTRTECACSVGETARSTCSLASA